MSEDRSEDRNDEAGLQNDASPSELIDQFTQAAQSEDHKSLRNLFSNAQAVAALESADAERKTTILAQPFVVDGLAGSGSAAAVIRILDTLDTDKQAKILSAQYAVGGLLHQGQAPAVFRLLEGMNADQKTQVLSTSSVVQDFARTKNGGKLMKLMRELNWAQQGEILSQYGAIRALREYGQRRQVRAMLDGIKVAQEPFLSAPAVLH